MCSFFKQFYAFYILTMDFSLKKNMDESMDGWMGTNKDDSFFVLNKYHIQQIY